MALLIYLNKPFGHYVLFYYIPSGYWNHCRVAIRFHEHCSTVEPISKVVEGIIGGLEQPEPLCDLSKAFDCVSHKILLTKLSRYFIRQQSLNKFLFDIQMSDFCKIKSGVPKDSVLGSLLFVVHSNDLFSYSLLCLWNHPNYQTQSLQNSIGKNELI